MTCWSHYFSYYITLLLLNSPPWLNTVTGDKKRLASQLISTASLPNQPMKGFATPQASMPPRIMAGLGSGMGRSLISLTSHSFFKKQWPVHRRNVGVVKKDSTTYLSTGSFRVSALSSVCTSAIWLCLWDVFLLGGFSPDPGIDIASIVVGFFLFNQGKIKR